MSQPHEQEPAFNKQTLVNALKPGEQLADPPARGENDLRDALGYEIYPIRGITGETGDSVFLAMATEGDSVEPVELVGPVKLTIRPVAGEGLIILHTPGFGVSPNLLAADGSPNNGGEIELSPGDSYSYLNTGTAPFVVRDDSRRIEDGMPHFDPSYEVPAANPELLEALAELGIRGI